MPLARLLLFALLLPGCGSDHIVAETKTDNDGDGFSTPTDCDDTHATVNPDAPEICDGLDNDCDGEIDEDPTDPTVFFRDADGDGHGDQADATTACDAPEGYVAFADDCDDQNAAISPSADERCDGVDNDCDGEIDEDSAIDAPTWYIDADEDGYGGTTALVACTAPDGFVDNDDDCDDLDPAYHPGAEESDCTDPNDYNCDGSSGYTDADGDGWAACGDCDDGDAARNPGATEVCDALDVDEDCDGLADDADDSVDLSSASEWRRDNDGDGYGDEATAAVTQCDAPAGWVDTFGDCNDADASISPAATEVCDALDTDEDCDGLADDDDPSVDPSTWSTFYQDADGDGYGDASATYAACDAPAGFVSDSTDCDDADGATNPGAGEVCDSGGTDEDCNGLADDADPGVTGTTTWYTDSDGDGYGDDTTAVSACDDPGGMVSVGGDCDDSDPDVNPGEIEVCDSAGLDEDCNGVANDDDAGAAGASTWYRDADGDGYGSTTSITACDQPTGYVAISGDCDDSLATVNPGATEVCDASDTDEDCDGLADDDDGSATGKSTFYRDSDGDGYGDASSTTSACDAPVGYVSNDDDCDDSNSSISPAGTEVCDAANADEDCDGKADDADSAVAGRTTWYRDADGDGYGTSSTTTLKCDKPSGYVSNDDDCDDSDGSINPLATEVCDSADTDEDCNGLADDDDPGVTGTSTFYRDRDGDGYGDASTTTSACDAPSGYCVDGSDCDDSNSSANPGEAEICTDGFDNDCDGVTDCGAYNGDYAANDSRLSGNYRMLYTTTASDDFGGKLASGDWDGDGNPELAIVASGQDSYGTDVGTVYFEEGPFANGSAVASSSALRVYYGSSSSSISVTGVWNIPDIDGDGIDEIVFGRSGSSTAYLHMGPLSSASAINSGYATTATGYYASGAGDFLSISSSSDNWAMGNRVGSSSYGSVAVYSGTSSSVTLKGEASGDYFGERLAGGPDNDVDGDGFDDLFVGASLEDSGGTFAGAVYVFTGASSLSGTISATSGADAKITGESASDYFGYQLAAPGDVDGDGDADLVATAPFDDTTATNAGAIYIFTAPLAALDVSDATVRILGASANADLGYDVPGVLDLDGDGWLDVLANAQWGDASATNDGTVDVIYGPLSGDYDLSDSSVYDAEFHGINSGDYFGGEVARIGDTDGDGTEEWAVSAPQYDYSSSATQSGAVWIYPGM